MVTIFTPVYNRAYIIQNLYESLKRQTDQRFEWIIVDDGSTDNLFEMVETWKKETRAFPIRYYYTENGGKHRAINFGVKMASYDAFLIVDSDDYLTDNAVELVHEWWQGIKDKEEYAGVSGLRGNESGGAIGGRPSMDPYIDATNMEREKYGLLGDKAEVYKTAVLRKYPFPEFPGENFLTEAVVWDRIAAGGFKLRWYNQIIYICDYRADGLTRQGRKIFEKNPKGWGLYLRQQCEIYGLPAWERINRYLEYYIYTREILPRRKILENLKIDEEILGKVIARHESCVKKTALSLGTKIGLYGGGVCGEKVFKFYRRTEVEIAFVMDKQEVQIPCRRIPADGQIPSVDAIIVTPKNGQNAIIRSLEKRTHNRIVSYDEWEACAGIKPAGA